MNSLNTTRWNRDECLTSPPSISWSGNLSGFQAVIVAPYGLTLLNRWQQITGPTELVRMKNTNSVSLKCPIFMKMAPLYQLGPLKFLRVLVLWQWKACTLNNFSTYCVVFYNLDPFHFWSLCVFILIDSIEGSDFKLSEFSTRLFGSLIHD